MEQSKLTEYYLRQAGGGVGHAITSIGPVYRTSVHRQQGRGCGAGVGRAFGRIALTAASPYVAKGVQAVAEEVTQAGMDLLNDIRTDRSIRNVGASTIARVRQAGSNIKKRAKRALTGRGKTKKGTKTKKKQKGGGATIKRNVSRKKSQKRKGSGRAKTRTSSTRRRTTHPDIFF